MPTQKPVAALSHNAQAVYAVLDPDKPLTAEEVAERVEDEMSAAESWDALQELQAAVRAALAMRGWTSLT